MQGFEVLKMLFEPFFSTKKRIIKKENRTRFQTVLQKSLIFLPQTFKDYCVRERSA